MAARERKRRKILPGIVLAVLLAGSPGCATRHARTQPGLGRHDSPPAYRDRPHLYPATRYTWDGRVMRHGWHGTLDSAISEEISRRQGSAWLISGNALFYSCFVGMPVLLVTGACTLAIELPASLISDTLMIPVDYAAIRRIEADTAFLEDVLLGTHWPVTAGELQHRYQPALGDAVIRELLEHPTSPAFADKVLLLIEAEMGLSLLAASAHLDAPLANRLVDQVAETPRHRQVLELLARNPEIPGETITHLVALSKSPQHNYLQPSLASNPATSADQLEALLPPHMQGVELPAETLTAMTRIAAHPAVSEITLARLAESCSASVFHAVAANPSTPVEALERMAARGIQVSQRALARHPEATVEHLEMLARFESHDLRAAIAVHPAASADLLRAISQDVDPERRRGRNMALLLARHPATPPDMLERLGLWADVEIDAALARHASTPPRTIAHLAGRAEGRSMAGNRLIRALAANPSTPEWFLLAQSKKATAPHTHELRRALVTNPATPSEGLVYFVDNLHFIGVGVDLLRHPNVTAEIIERAVLSASRPGWVINGNQPTPLLVLETAAGHPLATRETLQHIRARTEQLEQNSRVRQQYDALLRAIRLRIEEAEANLD